VVDHIVGALGVVLGLAAVVFAWFQYKDARTMTTQLTTIRDSMSTQYIGQFPDFVPKIIELIRSAKSDLLIVCDVPAYALFSDYKNFVRYRSAIEDRIVDGVKVRMVCLNAEQRLQLHHEQFDKAGADWEEWRTRNTERLRVFIEHQALHVSADQFTPELFISAVSRGHENALNHAFGRALIHDVSDPLSLYFWVVDGIRGVFSIPSFTENATEHGFLTSESKLLTAFEGIYTRLIREAKPLRRIGEKG
jgi:hypothetical protein